MCRWLAAIGACALLAGGSSEVHAAKPNRHLKKAKKAYANLDYTRVTPLLHRALKTAKSDEEKIEIHYLMGTMHTIYSRDEQAAEAFVAVLKLDSSFELPPDTSPKIRAAFAEAQQALPVGDEQSPNGAVPDEPDPDGETATVEEELPAGVFGPTDDMPGLSQRSRGSVWYKKWWVWTIVGVAVAAGTGALIYSLNQVDYPDYTHGPIPLR